MQLKQNISSVFNKKVTTKKKKKGKNHKFINLLRKNRKTQYIFTEKYVEELKPNIQNCVKQYKNKKHMF